MSAGWGRFQDSEAGPDWFAAAGEEPAAAPAWAEAEAEVAPPARAPRAESAPPSSASTSASAPSGWSTPAEPAEQNAPWADRKPAKKSPAKKSAAKKQSSGWSSRRKDRDPADADKPKPPQSREKLEQRAKNILLHHLGRQMQTRSQLADRLRKKEIPDDIAEAVLDRFEELHLLDDATYAETFVRSRHNERGLAKRALGYELRRRGIDDDTATEALSTLDEDQEAETARRLVDSRLRATRGLDPQVRTRRLVGMLARKGYSSSVAFRVVREALAAEGQDVDFEAPDFE